MGSNHYNNELSDRSEPNANLRKLPHEELRELHSYYKGIINHLPSNIYWLDVNCRGVGCNLNVLKTLQLASPDEFVGIDFATMAKKAHWTEGQGEKFFNDSQAVIKTGIPMHNIEEPPIPDGKGGYVHFLTSRVPLFKGKEVIGLVGVSVDITYQKKVELDLVQKKIELEKANEARKFFVANISHDMRTLLSGIVGISELLPSCRANDTQAEEFHRLLQSSSKKLLNMVNEILDLSWQGKARIHLEKENIARLFHDTSLFFQPAFEEKKLPLIIDISNEFPDIALCDPTTITRIINNLLENALKYTHKGFVKLRIRPVQQDDKSWIEIVVEDTGIGISQDKLDIIFDPFFRLHQTDVSDYNGLGIGLSVVKTLTESLGGQITVVSGLNEGSRFTCLLPLLTE